MKISHTLDDNICILELDGDILWAEAPNLPKYLDTVLETESVKGLVINLKQVSAIDSGGIGAILSIQKHFAGLKYPCVLCHLSTRVRDIFHFTKLQDLFRVHSTVEDALASL